MKSITRGGGDGGNYETWEAEKRSQGESMVGREKDKGFLKDMD